MNKAFQKKFIILLVAVFVMRGFFVASFASAGSAPTLSINDPDSTPAQNKTITAISDGTLTMCNIISLVCDGSDGSLIFIPYSSQTFTAEADNGTKICYKAINIVGTTYGLSDAIAGIDTTAPTNQDIIFAASISKVGGALVTVVSSGDATNTIWLAPSGTTAFITGQTMTAASGTATSILAPATEGNYRIFVIDAAGNISTQSTAILTVDNTPPIINFHSDVTAEATSSAGVLVNYTAPSAVDLVDGVSPANCTPASGSVFPLGDTTIICNAADAAGNLTVATTFKVTVQDTTKPVIALTGNGALIVEAKTSYTDVGATASDNYDGDITSIIVTVNSVNINVVGDYTITYNVTDAHGNTADQVTRIVHVVDTTAPILTLPAGVTISATNSSGTAVTFTAPTATDAVDGSVIISCNHNSGDNFPIGETTLTCGATDTAGNAATGTFKITVTLTQTGGGGGGGGGGAGSGTTFYTINASAGANGSISPVGSASVALGSSQTYTITPNIGYQVAEALVDGISKGAIKTYTFSSISAGHTISVVFSPTPICKFADINCDGSIDEYDFAILMANWGL